MFVIDPDIFFYCCIAWCATRTTNIASGLLLEILKMWPLIWFLL